MKHRWCLHIFAFVFLASFLIGCSSSDTDPKAVNPKLINETTLPQDNFSSQNHLQSVSLPEDEQHVSSLDSNASYRPQHTPSPNGTNHYGKATQKLDPKQHNSHETSNYKLVSDYLGALSAIERSRIALIDTSTARQQMIWNQFDRSSKSSMIEEAQSQPIRRVNGKIPWSTSTLQHWRLLQNECNTCNQQWLLLIAGVDRLIVPNECKTLHQSYRHLVAMEVYDSYVIAKLFLEADITTEHGLSQLVDAAKIEQAALNKKYDAKAQASILIDSEILSVCKQFELNKPFEVCAVVRDYKF